MSTRGKLEVKEYPKGYICTIRFVGLSTSFKVFSDYQVFLKFYKGVHKREYLIHDLPGGVVYKEFNSLEGNPEMYINTGSCKNWYHHYEGMKFLYNKEVFDHDKVFFYKQ